MPRRIVILGAGISGLAAAWFLRRYLGNQVHLTLLEKSERAGGWIHSIQHQGFLFEQGPRSCRTAGTGRETLALIEELGLQQQVIIPHADAQQRYIYYQKRLEKVPGSLWMVPFSPLTKGWGRALWRDWTSPKRGVDDESIGTFFDRRLGSAWTNRLIDPLVSGIYAGDCERLSLKSCFPQFDAWEQQRGSLLRGAWGHRPEGGPDSPFIRTIRRSPLFSFREGMETLPRALVQQLGHCVRLGVTVEGVDFHADGVKIKLEQGGSIEADHVISTLPLSALGGLFASQYSSLAARCKEIDYASVTVVNIGYDYFVLPCSGFGYLIPSEAQSKVLGCVWDSCIFPQQNGHEGQTRLTVMLGGSRHPEVEQLNDDEVVRIALMALEEQCGVQEKPVAIQVKRAEKAIPQYEVGYQRWKEEVMDEMLGISPHLTLSGSWMTGVSINDCVAQARRVVLGLSGHKN